MNFLKYLISSTFFFQITLQLPGPTFTDKITLKSEFSFPEGKSRWRLVNRLGDCRYRKWSSTLTHTAVVLGGSSTGNKLLKQQVSFGLRFQIASQPRKFGSVMKLSGQEAQCPVLTQPLWSSHSGGYQARVGTWPTPWWSHCLVTAGHSYTLIRVP